MSDLIGVHSSWDEAFVAFESMCSPQACQIMTNMQVLHECRDSRNDHRVRTRANHRYRFDPIANDGGRNRSNVGPNSLGPDLDEVDALGVLFSIRGGGSFRS